MEQDFINGDALTAEELDRLDNMKLQKPRN